MNLERQLCSTPLPKRHLFCLLGWRNAVGLVSRLLQCVFNRKQIHKNWIWKETIYWNRAPEQGSGKPWKSWQGGSNGRNAVSRIALLPWAMGSVADLALTALAPGRCGEPRGAPHTLHSSLSLIMHSKHDCFVSERPCTLYASIQELNSDLDSARPLDLVFFFFNIGNSSSPDSSGSSFSSSNSWKEAENSSFCSRSIKKRLHDAI